MKTELEDFDVRYETLGQNASDSMPMGNGQVGLNVWTEQNGDVLFYVSRTDSISESCRFLKLGRIRVHFEPNPFTAEDPPVQRLRLRDGIIEIGSKQLHLAIVADAMQNVVRISGNSEQPIRVTATSEIWRTGNHRLKGEELISSWTMRDAPDSVEVWESADVVADVGSSAICWYHHNESSVVPFTLERQGIAALQPLLPDPIINRTFGCYVNGKGFVKSSPTSISSESPSTEFELNVVTDSRQIEFTTRWVEILRTIAENLDSFADARKRTENWWREFWKRSYVFVSGDEDAERITQGYILQRFVTAAAGRGSYPIKFNGSIFTVEPKYAGASDYNPDWRKWGDAYWWQNTRLPYAPLPATGDEDVLQSLFDFYLAILPISKARAKLYYEAAGVYFPETVTLFGTYGNGDYGWNREGKAFKDVDCPWWMFAWQQGLELLTIMLDSYDINQDEQFLKRKVLPMAQEVMSYYDTRFKRDAQGKLVISPTQAVETYWFEVENDTPSVAGLISVLDRLLTLKATLITSRQLGLWQKLRDELPSLPTKITEQETYILPAQKYKDQRNNVENPELYAVWPFQLYSVARGNTKTAINTFNRRVEKAEHGWSYDATFAALLGLTDEAKRQLISKSKNSHPKYRWPATWGPNYDWLPDQTHGGNLMLTLQAMLFQVHGDHIYLFPAWPKGWDVSFRLHGPKRTLVEAELKGGKVTRLVVSPASRKSAVHLVGL